MDMGIVLGTVTATRKDPSLQGARLLIIQPVDEYQNAVGGPLIAVDGTTVAGYGALVFYVTGGDAIVAIPGRRVPADVAVVGLVDSLSLAESSQGSPSDSD